ncbi:MAG: hypothetical protein NT049_00750, partial [Planctomycetota bacterium]|nr:hypothetical protein [Planctomycetota bacterium]
APLIITGAQIAPKSACCLLANLNSFAYDFIARQKVGGLHLNFFIVEQVPTLPPDAYEAKCPWDKRKTLETWISERVLKLTYTANDMKPLAEAAGMDPPVNKWKEEERAELAAELDAAYFLLYGIDREDVEYILSTFAGAGKTEDGLFDGLTAAQRVLAAYDALSQRRGWVGAALYARSIVSSNSKKRRAATQGCPYVHSGMENNEHGRYFCCCLPAPTASAPLCGPVLPASRLHRWCRRP